MRRLTLSPRFTSRNPTILFLILLFLTTAVSAQDGSAPKPTPPKDDVQRRIERARALAAAHQLETAAKELEVVRTGTRDEVVHHVTSVMLIGIYVEDGNYSRAEFLLDETFRLQSVKKDGIPGYYAVAGQAVNSVRHHLDRYRSFGINISGAELPAEALQDLNRLRGLLERMIVQAKALTRNNPKAYEALTLLEDLSAIRLSLALDAKDRTNWENEHASARNAIASSHTEIASIAGIPQLREGNQGARNAGLISTAANVEGTNASAKEDGKGPQTISSGSLNHRATKRVVPVYPPVAKNAGTSGVVRVYVTVDETGRVAAISRTEGPLALKNVAEDAARGWQFPASVEGGKAVRVSGYIEFTFKL